MARNAKTIDTAEKAHQERVQFNSGFHDATQGVQHGWAIPERNFGFGSAIKASTPEEVLAAHPSRFYAEGWIRGYWHQMEAGAGAERPATSTLAWDEFQAAK